MDVRRGGSISALCRMQWEALGQSVRFWMWARLSCAGADATGASSSSQRSPGSARQPLLASCLANVLASFDVRNSRTFHPERAIVPELVDLAKRTKCFI